MGNQVNLIGCISSQFTFSHSIYGEGFYTINLSVKRNSGYIDVIPLLISGRLIDVRKEYIHKRIYVTGQFRSYNVHEETKNRLKLYVFVNTVEEINEPQEVNDVFLEGNLCKKPTYRLTPYGREITDLLLAVNRSFNKSDYIPCICWGINAHYASSLCAGDRVRVAGRVQSRDYEKLGEIKTAYELSVNLIEVC